MKLLAIVFHCIFLCTGELQKLLGSGWNDSGVGVEEILLTTWEVNNCELILGIAFPPKKKSKSSHLSGRAGLKIETSSYTH